MEFIKEWKNAHPDTEQLTNKEAKEMHDYLYVTLNQSIEEEYMSRLLDQRIKELGALINPCGTAIPSTSSSTA